MTVCATGCGGSILDDGYCDTCGAKAPDVVAAAPAHEPNEAPAAATTGRSLVTGSARSGGSRRTASTRSARTTQRRGIGAGMVHVDTAPSVDPTTIVKPNPEVAERKRFCGSCGAPVGRSKGDSEGRLAGFCGRCRTPYDFHPTLQPGVLVGGQYEVVGAIAHGGLGWIYLGKDKAVSDRWVVLKGLLNAGDEAAMAAAVAERRFLAEVQHPNIVEIYNFATHAGSGYTVMEYVGGPSLNQILKQRRKANNSKPDPLPVETACAYVLAVLPAFSYLHARGLLYCDFKPDNLIQVGDDVKLIDLGGVRRIDDPSGDIYGTIGFQAPEIAEMGPTVASDIHTIGRTLAALTLDFRGYQSRYEHDLPEPADHPALAQNDSFYRLLRKATAPHPDDRFQTIAEFGEQLLGVLRELVAVRTKTPRPGTSTDFAPAGEKALPELAIDPNDPAAAVLTNLPDDPAQVLDVLRDAVAHGQAEESVELRLRRARAYISLGNTDAAAAELDSVEADDPWEWRTAWLRGVLALELENFPTAATHFERCLSETPGELAPKLAMATTAERLGHLDLAAVLYDIVSTVDPTIIAAANGLARCRDAKGDTAGALAAYERIPATHRARSDAQVDAARMLVDDHEFVEAARVLDGLTLAERAQAELEVELFQSALAALDAGAVSPSSERVRGHALDQPGVRDGLEAAFRRLATLTDDRAQRHQLVDAANSARRVTWL